MRTISQDVIKAIANYINETSNKDHRIPTKGNPQNPETPQYFEIVDFDEIDNSERRFYAIDGSSNSQEFFNGLYIGIYTAGYICYHKGKQIRMNDSDDPVILGKSYFPQKILISQESHRYEVYDELLEMQPVRNLIKFFGVNPDEAFAYKKEVVCSQVSSLLDFCQEILEWALVYEIINRDEIQHGDYILKDGTLRSLKIKQAHLVKLGKLLKQKQIRIVGITKRSPIKMELSYTFRKIDDYLQNQLKDNYPFKNTNPSRKKLGCWFEVPDNVLEVAYSGDMYARKDIKSGRGFGLFFCARLDYVEKLQNYDWVIADVNIYDAIPEVEQEGSKGNRAMNFLMEVFKELSRLTQEHYILGYPYPLVEVHNFVSLSKDFKNEIINLVKLALYNEQRMDNVDIENLFLDIHDLF